MWPVRSCGRAASLLGGAESCTNRSCLWSAAPLVLRGVTWCHVCTALHEWGLHEFLVRVWVYGWRGEQLLRGPHPLCPP